tara:strand:- start:142 stop:786 length:645 start_codon:yes stop_codon:yes gene_type:complete
MPLRVLTVEETGRAARAQAPRPNPYGEVRTEGVLPGTEKDKSVFAKEQKDAAAFAIRMEEDIKIMDDLAASGFNPVNVYDQTIESAPFIPDFLENILVSGKYQVYRNAAKDFAMAQLRRESGAAITASEMEMAKDLYIPTFGDKPPTLAAKSASRERNFQNMKSSAGKAYDRAKTDIKTSSKPDLVQEEALDLLRERAKTNPQLRAKLKAAGVL